MEKAFCSTCQNGFDQSETRAFAEKLGSRAPKACPQCRQQRRVSFRNERNLYARSCDACKKHMISLYDADAPHTVYCAECWWGDSWNPLDYGRDFDFSKTFTENFAGLIAQVPRLGMIGKNSVNSDYCLFSGNLKNCYLVFSALESEDCLYGHQCNWSKDCVDTSFCYSSELCYETIDSKNCYNCAFIQNCERCTDCRFCYNCQGLTNCFGCVNMSNKQYCIYNEQYSREAYEEKMKEIAWNVRGLEELKKTFAAFKSQHPHRYLNVFNCENCSGDYIRDSKNCMRCFDLIKGEECAYIWTGIEIQNCVDCSYTAKQNGVIAEWCYDCLSAFPGYNQIHCSYCWESQEMAYCDHCFNSNNCFGSSSLKRQTYCIFNKQYTREEFENLRSKIIEHMKKTGEFGDFLAPSLSPFAYNETLAQDFFPLEKEVAASLGYRWKDKNTHDYKAPTASIPELIQEVPDSILQERLACTLCARNYRIIEQELTFYRRAKLPLPRTCPNCRHQNRMNQRNQRTLWQRTCGKCGRTIETTYSLDRPEPIYCEECFRGVLY